MDGLIRALSAMCFLSVRFHVPKAGYLEKNFVKSVCLVNNYFVSFAANKIYYAKTIGGLDRAGRSLWEVKSIELRATRIVTADDTE